MELSNFVENLALFHVVVLFFFYLNSFGQENVNTQRDANVTESVVMPPELWRSDTVQYFWIYCVKHYEIHGKQSLYISLEAC